MLLEFEVGNFLSFKNPVRFSMVAANPIKEFVEENTFRAGRYHLLKNAVIYGANASGKSNLLNAMGFMRWFVLNSSKEMQVKENIRVSPFKLDTNTENAPSHFEICFLHDIKQYRYGFEADRKIVTKEWLFVTEKQKESVLFLREGDGIDVSEDFSEGKKLEEKTRENALFLSVVAQFNGKIAGSILNWFQGFRALHGLRDQDYERFTVNLLQDESSRKLLVDFIRNADVGIKDFIVNEIPIELMPLSEKASLNIIASNPVRLATVHQKFKNGVQEGLASLDFSSEESEGTKKFFRIAGPLLDCLRNQYVVCIDELDAKLHPLLTRAVVRLFNSNDSNPRNAQLIFATHDTNLLQYGNLRRDQIWFTEKNQYDATDLYSLAEFKTPEGAKVRNDAAFEKNYIQGKYGAIPFLGDLEALLKEAGNGSSLETE